MGKLVTWPTVQLEYQLANWPLPEDRLAIAPVRESNEFLPLRQACCKDKTDVGALDPDNSTSPVRKIAELIRPQAGNGSNGKV